MRFLLLAAAVAAIAACHSFDPNATSDAEAETERSAPTLAGKAFAIAETIATTMEIPVDERCVTEGSLFGPVADGEHAFNIVLGPFDEELDDCGDPHFSIEVFFDRDGQFLRARLIDA